MIDLAKVDELARKLSDLVPPGLKDARADLEQNFKAVLQGGLAKLDLVTRQEFDIQAAVLRRSRERLAQRTQALRRANEGLEQFVHFSAHDLREPLTLDEMETVLALPDIATAEALLAEAQP